MTLVGKKDLQILGICVFLGAALFASHLRVPGYIALGIPYILVVLITLWSSRPAYTYYIAAYCTLLIGMGHFFFPAHDAPKFAHINHFFEVVVLWISAFLAHGYRHKKESLTALYSDLKLRVQERTAELAETNKALIEKIKEQKTTESFLRKSEERFGHLLNTAGIVPWEGELKSKRFTYVGEKAGALLGFPVVEWYKEGFWINHVYPADREHTTGLLQRLSETLDYFELDYRMVTSTGEVVWIQDLVSVVSRKGVPAMLRGFMLNITERKRAEEIIRKSEARLRGVLDAAPDGMLIVRQDGRISMANKQIETISGFKSEDLVGGKLDILLPERFRKRHFAHMNSYFSAPRVREMGQGLELSALHKDGHEIPVEIGLSPLYTEEGIFTITGIRDVSWKKEAEEVARENARRLRQITENIKEILWIGTPDWKKIVYVSPAYEEIWERPVSSLYQDGRSWMEGIYPDDLGGVEKAVQKQIDGDFSDPVFPNFRVIGKNGKIRWISARAYPVYDENGKIFRITGVAEDITGEVEARSRFEREHAETVRLKSLLEIVMQNMTTGLLVTDSSGRILLLNRVGGEILGLDPDNMGGIKLGEMFPALRVFQTAADEEGEAREVLFRRPDDRRIPIGFSSSRMGKGEKGMGGAITVFKDLTDQHEIEKRLREKEKLATIGEVAAGIAHEVKNPLFAISSGVQLLQHTLNIEKKGLRTFDIIFQETMRVDRLIKQLLNYSGKRELHRSSVSLPDLLEEVLSLHHGLIDGKKLKIKKKIFCKQFPVFADRDLVTQVLVNLILNAIEVSPEGGTLAVTCRHGKTADSVRVKINDSGPGVPREIREKIFDPFYSTKKGNTGMGLAISRRIILDHGGDIWVEAGKNGGASFNIEIPLKPVDGRE